MGLAAVTPSPLRPSSSPPWRPMPSRGAASQPGKSADDEAYEPIGPHVGCSHSLLASIPSPLRRRGASYSFSGQALEREIASVPVPDPVQMADERQEDTINGPVAECATTASQKLALRIQKQQGLLEAMLCRLRGSTRLLDAALLAWRQAHAVATSTSLHSSARVRLEKHRELQNKLANWRKRHAARGDRM